MKEWEVGTPHCVHKRVIHLKGKCSDSCWVNWPDDTKTTGYVPSNLGIDQNGDYIDIKICCDCHIVLGFTPDGLKESKERAEEDQGPW
jgi:hypothetical protein